MLNKNDSKVFFQQNVLEPLKQIKSVSNLNQVNFDSLKKSNNVNLSPVNTYGSYMLNYPTEVARFINKKMGYRFIVCIEYTHNCFNYDSDEEDEITVFFHGSEDVVHSNQRISVVLDNKEEEDKYHKKRSLEIQKKKLEEQLRNL